MSTILTRNKSQFTEQAARALADELNAEPLDDWYYVAVPAAGANYNVLVYDELDVFVGYM